MLRPVTDLAEFARLQLASKDIDPLYDVLHYLEKGMELEQQLWLTFLYSAYYNLPSAWEVFNVFPRPNIEILQVLLTLPTGVERRNLRGGHRMARHLESLIATRHAYGGFDPWVRFHLSDEAGTGTYNWDRAFWELQTVWGNGRWAGYKTCELLQKVNGYPLKAPNMGNEYSSGPRHGMALFRRDLPAGNSERSITLLDAFAEDLRTELRIFHEVEAEIEELETILCDFHAMADGRYYSGHDIDAFMEQIQASKRPDLMEPLWAARQAVFAPRYLGEVGGWNGRDRRRMKVYKELGGVIGR